jgi:hypothetical protein
LERVLMIKECDEDLQHPPHHGYNECIRGP